jgi:hypothetical protein
MSDIQSLIKMLQSKDHNKRYDACELLRVSPSLPLEGLTKRAPDAGDSAQISSSFTRLIIFLVGRLRRPCPSAGNANR